MWYRLASHLGQSVQALKKQITHSEFLEWWAYLQAYVWDWETKLEGYLAQIACETCRGRIRKPASVGIKDFLLQIRTPQESKMDQSKQTWAAALGIDLNKSKKHGNVRPSLRRQRKPRNPVSQDDGGSVQPHPASRSS